MLDTGTPTFSVRTVNTCTNRQGRYKMICMVWYYTSHKALLNPFQFILLLKNAKYLTTIKLSEFEILKQYFTPNLAKFLDTSDTQDLLPVSLSGPRYSHETTQLSPAFWQFLALSCPNFSHQKSDSPPTNLVSPPANQLSDPLSNYLAPSQIDFHQIPGTYTKPSNLHPFSQIQHMHPDTSNIIKNICQGQQQHSPCKAVMVKVAITSNKPKLICFTQDLYCKENPLQWLIVHSHTITGFILL